MNERDNLMLGPEKITRPYRLIQDPSLYDKIRSGMVFHVPSRLRFRKEKGFYLINIRWANTITCPDWCGEFLERYQSQGEGFTYREFGESEISLLSQLYAKDALVSDQESICDQRSYLGLSANI